jgi:hypothetical protein
VPFKPGNTSAIKHGGAAGESALSTGEPLRGLAAAAEQEVAAELADNGSYSMIEHTAIRLQAVANLYYDAIQKAADNNDLKALDHYVARYGWLAGSALRAWAQVRQEQRRKDNLTSETVLEAVQRGKENKSNTD